VDGLVVGNFRVKEWCCSSCISSKKDSSAKKRTLTIPAASAGTYTVELYDSVPPPAQLSKFQQDYCLNLT
jgi:hypothetical protein